MRERRRSGSCWIKSHNNGNWYAVEIIKRYLELFEISCMIRGAADTKGLQQNT